MSDSHHIKEFRLFDMAFAEAAGKGFQLGEWEGEHLEKCDECQNVLKVFARQVRARPPYYMACNGEINPTEGLYQNLCCELELFLPAGSVFPDCERHPNLPTVWKRVSSPLEVDPKYKHSA
jgi:hypothetical protein